MALQPNLALRQIIATLLLLATLSGHASNKPPAKAHKAVSHKAAAHKASTRGPVYGKTKEATALADELAQQYKLPQTWVREQISKAQHLKGVPKMVLPPTVPTAKNWRAYRERFIESRRIDAGTQFWQTYESALTRAEQTYGVPAEMIVGIIGVETFYGQNMGNYRVLDALTTLTLNFPAAHPRAAERQAFFKSELGHFLAQAHSQGNASATGSFAGAMGWPQFMPSSVAKFAVDFDGDGRIDLRNSPVDAIGSVANYFKAFGWQTGMPTHYPVGFDEARLDKPTLLAPDILPSFSVSNFTAKGAVLDEQAQKHAGPLALVELFNGDEPPSYVAGTENFYVVTRYNWSSYYALAVIELGQAIKVNRALSSIQSNAR
ncbi:MAG: lytic murein transglycosylase B [Burkholderiales bacterium 35-55-47]|jgi:membrane-bound lytic murein transglycosylase B|nr:MAG: lytic murein transglycosylase B [Burkholderiales bacterium 35-55-47]OYZ74474.1 MAG: lytic murein transglycosylase B [Burkholderiales bacterium 24-55-52]OZB01636.1 MAG: lytic murein transglycosylase B [Burkholderiales bacterium 39-55-53]